MAAADDPLAPLKTPAPRALTAAFLLCIVSIGLLIAAMMLFFFGQQGEDRDVLGDYVSPRQIITTLPRDPDTRPRVLEAGSVIIRGYRCVEGNKTVVVQQSITFHPIPPTEGRTPVREPADPTELPLVPRLAGCFDQDIVVVIPARVAPGLWHIESIERVPATGELRSWFTEPFEVIPR